jgi:type VI secretion system secreted protein Hcp
MILVHIDGVPGDCKIPGYKAGENWEDDIELGRGRTTPDSKESSGYFIVNSFSFGVQREMKESGEKGGTLDINIGIGELEDCEIGKSMDRASPTLAQFAISGNSLGTAIIDFVEMAGTNSKLGKPFCYMRFKLDRCFVKSWKISGDADDRPTEDVSLYYNKIAFEYLYTEDGRVFNSAGCMEWDNIHNEAWTKHGIKLLKR